MADFSFTPAAAGIRPVPQTSLADMIGVARGAQAYQQAQQVNPLQVQQAQAELQRIQGLMPEEIKRATAEARVSEETATPRITEAQLRAEQAGVDLNQHYANISRGVYGGLLTDPDFVTNNSGAMVKKLENAAKFLKESGVPTHKSSMHDQLTKLAETDPKAAYQMIQNGIQQGGGVTSQFAQANAPFQQVATGQGTQLIPTNQYQQTRPGIFVQQQLPPTTPVVNPATGQTEYLGSQPLPTPGAPVVAPKPVIAAVGAPQQAMLTATGAVVGPDWVQTVQDASNANTRIGLFQDIKKYAPEAFTGVGGERKALSAGILRLVGIDAYTAEQTATEQLAKNANLLALAGGNTDAARSLAEAANPNKKLNEESIKKIADQLIGVEKMKLAKQQYLQPFTTDAQEYQKRKLQFDNVADPRLFQEMTPDSVAKLKASMSPAAIKELTDKIQAARALGILR